MCKKVFILGAGASIEFLKHEDNKKLSTEYLTGILRNKDFWVETFREIRKILGNKMRNIDIDIDDFFFLIEDFCQNFEEFYENSARTVNPMVLDFEKIISFLDFVVKYLSNLKTPRIAKFEPYNHILINNEKINNLSSFKEFKLIPLLAREVLHRCISLFDFDNSSVKLVRDFFLKEKQEYTEISIVSLNYDPLIYESLKGSGFFNGFENNRFQENIFVNSKHTVSFLHGHQFFYGSCGSIEMAGSYQEAFQLRVDGIFTNNHHTINQKGDGISLITGTNKEKNLQIPVYHLYFHKIMHDISTAKEVCCIGYGCRDDHINSALRWILLLGKPITFVDYQKNQDDILNGFLVKGSIQYTLNKTIFIQNGAKDFFEESTN